MMIDGVTQRIDRRKTVNVYSGQIPIRRQRIEHWVNKDRSTPIKNDKIIKSSPTLKTSLRPKQADNTLLQADRRLNMELFQLGEKREKFIEQSNFDQKLFANKQALLHKNNHDILQTLNHVRKCCKYIDYNNHNEIIIDSTIDLKDNHTNKINRSRPLLATEPIVKRNLNSNVQTQINTAPTDISLQHNIKHIESSKKLTEEKLPITIKPIEIPDDKENSNDHAQIRTNIKSGSQSAHASSKSRSIIDYEQPNRNIITVHGVRPHHNYTTDSTASIPIINHKKDEKKPLSKMTRPSSRTLVVKSTLQEFRQYPERFLSKTNRYLPLLRHQAVKTTESNKCHTKQEKEHTQFSSSNSHHSSETNVTFDDESLSLIEEVKERKSDIDSHISDLINHDHRQSKEVDKLNKIDLMKTVSDDKSERKLALLRLRDREYNHLQTLIHSNRIDHILKPLSSIKTIENQSRKTINLNYILNSMDSFYCSKTLDKHKRKQISIDKNPSKLPILIS